jgi:hypothetical protein
MTIKFFIRNVYGTDLIYLADESQGHTWVRLTGNKTITGTQMELLNKLTGVMFEQVLAPTDAVRGPVVEDGQARRAAARALEGR